MIYYLGIQKYCTCISLNKILFVCHNLLFTASRHLINSWPVRSVHKLSWGLLLGHTSIIYDLVHLKQLFDLKGETVFTQDFHILARGNFQWVLARLILRLAASLPVNITVPFGRCSKRHDQAGWICRRVFLYTSPSGL